MKNYYIFKNAIKQSFRNKIQLISLVLLVILSATIFSLLRVGLTKLESQYEYTIRESNVHDFVIDLSNTRSVTPETEYTRQKEESMSIENIAQDSSKHSFYWERTEYRTFSLNNNDSKKTLKLASYKTKDNEKNFDQRINKLIIQEGHTLGSDELLKKGIPLSKQIIVNKEFADNNNINIGSSIRVQADQMGDSILTPFDALNPEYSLFNWFKVVGFGSSSDMMMPIINETTIVPDKVNEGIFYIDASVFGLNKTRSPTSENSIWDYDTSQDKLVVTSEYDREVVYYGKYNNADLKNDQSAINNMDTELKKEFLNNSNVSSKLFYALGDNDYKYSNRTSAILSTIIGYQYLMYSLLLIIIVVSVTTVTLITKKNIDKNKAQLGVFKSLGYSNGAITMTSMSYPIISSLIGSVLAFIPAAIFQILIVGLFLKYFNLPFGGYTFDFASFLYGFLIIFGFLGIVSMITTYIAIKAKPLELLKSEGIKSVSRFSMMVSAWGKHRSFSTRFRLAIFSSSISKIITVALTMFMGTTLMAGAVIGPKIMRDNQSKSFEGMNYDHLIEYEQPVYNSPYTHFQTYNPTQKPWEYIKIQEEGQKYVHANRFGWDINETDPNSEKYYGYQNEQGAFLSTKILQDLYNNSINQEYYAPTSPQFKNSDTAVLQIAQEQLTALNGKMFTKAFLSSLETLDGGFFYPIVNSLSWDSGAIVYNDYSSKKDISKVFTDEGYVALKKYYNEVRIAQFANVNSKYLIDQEKSSQDPSNINIEEVTRVFNSLLGPIGTYKTEYKDRYDEFINEIWNENMSNFFENENAKYRIRLKDEKEFLNINPGTPGYSDKFRDDWIMKTLIHFALLYHGRMGQSVTMGVFSKSPNFIKEQITASIINEEEFNVGFNVIPFDNTYDELGTYFNAKQNNYNFKIFGLEKESELQKKSLIQLYDYKKKSLNRDLYQNQDGIIINQTIAKQLGLGKGDSISFEALNFELQSNIERDNYETVQKSDIIFDELDGGAPELIQNVSMPKGKIEVDGKSMDNVGSNASEYTQAVKKAEVIKLSNNSHEELQILGVTDSYGEPKAYVNKTKAEEILKWDISREMHFELFKKEWEFKGVQTLPVTNEKFDFNILQDFETYADFETATKDNTNLQIINKVFENQYPLFNFKMSESSRIYDIRNSLSTTNSFSDYSKFGLDGGVFEGVDYNRNGVGTTNFIAPLSVSKEILGKLTSIINIIMIQFIIFASIISFLIIMLTSNLIIYEYRKVIATIKLLGYKDNEVTLYVIGMYIPVIIAMFMAGMVFGFFAIKWVIDLLAIQTSWVLPFIFTWWIPVVVFLIIGLIYTSTYFISWKSMQKIKPVNALRYSN